MDVHVLPLNDLRAHITTIGCWCAPRVVVTPGTPNLVVVHHAEDGRDLIEQHGIN